MITDNIMEFCDKDRKLFKFYGIQSMERNTLINIFDLLQLWAQPFSNITCFSMSYPESAIQLYGEQAWKSCTVDEIG